MNLQLGDDAAWSAHRGTDWLMGKKACGQCRTFHFKLPRSAAGLPRIPNVSATSQPFQG